MQTEQRTDSEGRPLSIGDFHALNQIMRSKQAIEDPDTSADNRRCPSELGNTNVSEFLDGITTMINGPEHRNRRKVLNSLVRPEQLVRWREEVTLPSVDRWVLHALRERADGSYEFDLAEVLELVFLEFAAKIIGLHDIESAERMTRLRSCVVPIFGGLNASHFEDRAGITAEGIRSKQIFADEYFRPSYDRVREQMARVERGEIADEDVPLSLMKMMLKGLDPTLEDEDAAVREAVLFFVATTGTSVQSILTTVDFLGDWLPDHPEDVARLDDLEFLSNCLQDSIRLRGPWAAYLTRLAIGDVEVDGFDVPEGTEIRVRLPTAGRDKELFGEDANDFNPHRQVPKGVHRYGLGFGTGQHQCLGLRSVLGNDGVSGSHIHLLRRFLRAGVRPDPENKADFLPIKDMNPDEEIPIYLTFPVILPTAWEIQS